MSLSQLYARDYHINKHITINIPTVRDVIEYESEYYDSIALLTSTPHDMMVQLDDVGIDFSTISSWELFCLLFEGIKQRDLSLLFCDLDLSKFKIALNKQANTVVLLNEETGAVIDELIYNQICEFFRKMLYIEKNDKLPGNEEARKFMIERARKKLKRALRKQKTQGSNLEQYIVALVNTPEFPYDYNSVLDLTIYQFYASLHQIIKKIHFDNLMIGCYAGTVNTKELDQKELVWINTN